MSALRRALFTGSKAALQALSAPARRAEARSLLDPEAAQQRLLARIADHAAKTEYGRHCHLAGGESPVAFANRVPLADYDELRPWADRQLSSRAAVLAPARVKFFETTSGSSGSSKHIPYTAALQRSMTRMFLLWAFDLLAHGPKLETGLAYFSVSPNFRVAKPTEASAPIGVQDERDYLRGPTAGLLSRLVVTVPGLEQLTTPEAFHRALMARLLREENLEVLSVWSPTFLLVPLEYAQAHTEEFELSGPRLAAVKAGRWNEVWPKLKLISCWADGTSAIPARQLGARFPGVLLQGKGLLATEGPLTYPRVGLAGGVPLLNEIFFEFLTDAGELRLLHQLEEGEELEVVITQQAGLLRYRLGDRVKVCGRLEKTPLLQFLGRVQAVSDLVGEKLNEAVVAKAFRDLGIASGVLIPDVGRRRYVLVTSRATKAASVDLELQKAFHYQRARQLGQLPALESLEHAALPQLLQAVLAGRGMKLGDIKDRALLWRQEEADAALRALGRA